MKQIIPQRIIKKPWYRWVVYIIAMSAFTFGVLITAISVIIPDLMRDLQIDAYKIGVISSAYALTYAFMQIPGGTLADRIGPQKVLTIFLVIGGLGILLFSVAPNYGIGLGGRVLTAIGVSVLYVSQIKLIRGWFSISEMGMAMGIGSSIQAIGSLLSTPLIAYFSITIGWRITFTIIGVVVLLFSVLCWIFVRDFSPNQQEVEIQVKPELKEQLIVFLKMVAKEPQFIKLFFITLFAYGGVSTIFHVWGIPFLMQSFDYSKMEASWMMAFSSLCSLIGAPIIGYLSDKVIHRRVPLLIVGLIGISFPSLLIAIIGNKLGTIGLILTFGVIGITIGGVLLAYTLINEMVPHSYSGIFTAFLNMGPYLGSSIFMLISGKLLGSTKIFTSDGTPFYDPHKYQLVFLLGAIIGIVAIILSFTVHEKAKIKTQD